MAREAILLGEMIGEQARREERSPGNLASGNDPAEQQLLPPLRWLMQPDDSRFAHPAESHFSHLLTFYGIRWSYEPTTFAVRWGPKGEPLQFVTPDFYLPDHDCYLELTTMRQRLVTRKNRKFRLLRQHYPNVNVRILYLRDFERLRRTYRNGQPLSRPTLGDVVFDGKQLDHRIEELAGDYSDLWASKAPEERAVRPLLLGVGRGSQTFLEALSSRRAGARRGSRPGQHPAHDTRLSGEHPARESGANAARQCHQSSGDGGSGGSQFRTECRIRAGVAAAPRRDQRRHLHAP